MMDAGVHLKRLGWGACVVALWVLFFWVFRSLPKWTVEAVLVGLLILLMYLCGMAVEFTLDVWGEKKEMPDNMSLGGRDHEDMP